MAEAEVGSLGWRFGGGSFARRAGTKARLLRLDLVDDELGGDRLHRDVGRHELIVLFDGSSTADCCRMVLFALAPGTVLQADRSPAHRSETAMPGNAPWKCHGRTPKKPRWFNVPILLTFCDLAVNQRHSCADARM